MRYFFGRVYFQIKETRTTHGYVAIENPVKAFLLLFWGNIHVGIYVAYPSIHIFQSCIPHPFYILKISSILQSHIASFLLEVLPPTQPQCFRMFFCSCLPTIITQPCPYPLLLHTFLSSGTKPCPFLFSESHI